MSTLDGAYFDLAGVDARIADDLDVVGLGRSREGRPIRAVSLGSGPEVALVVANIHGVEHVSAHVALRFLDELRAGEGDFGALRERARVIVVPVLNPDGYQRTFDAGGRGSLKELRTNAAGVDLNRNFPAPGPLTRWPFGGSDDERKATFRGPEPASEPEVQALLSFTEGMKVRAVASLHSFMGSLVTPRLPGRDEFRAYEPLCAAFREKQRAHRYFRLASRFVDGFTGELEDWFHHERGAWAMCVETFPVPASFRQHLRAPSTFWRFNPRQPAYWAEHDAPAIAGFLLAALEQPGPVREMRSCEPDGRGEIVRR